MAPAGSGRRRSRVVLRRAAVVVAAAAASCAAVLLLAFLPCPADAVGSCATRARHPGAYGAHAARNLSDFRGRLLADLLARNFTASFGAPGADAWRHYDFASPFISRCPPAHGGGPPLRYGKAGDGGKLLCDLSPLARQREGGDSEGCVVYSLGSNGDYSFENDILKRTPCTVHTFDCTYNGALGPRTGPKGTSVAPGRHAYWNTCIGAPPPDPEPSGARPSQFETLEAAMGRLGHRRSGVDVMKVDVEGHELSVLATLRPTHRLPDQLVVELHLYRGNPVKGYELSPAAPHTIAQLGLLVGHLASLGYGIIAREDNTMTQDIGCCTELTFLKVEAHAHQGQRPVGWWRWCQDERRRAG